MRRSLRSKRIWKPKSARVRLSWLLIGGVLTLHFPAYVFFIILARGIWESWMIEKVYGA